MQVQHIGYEFEAGFAKILQDHHIQRGFTCSKSPRGAPTSNAATAPCKISASKTTKTRSSPIWPGSTQNSPTGSAATTPSAPTMA